MNRCLVTWAGVRSKDNLWSVIGPFVYGDLTHGYVFRFQECFLSTSSCERDWFAICHVARIIHDTSIFSYSQHDH